MCKRATVNRSFLFWVSKVLFHFFQKQSGSHPFYLLERGTEITGIGKPDFIGYFIDIEIGICE